MKTRRMLKYWLLWTLSFTFLFAACGGGGGDGGGSSSVSVTVPATPASVYATAGRTVAQITWAASSGATSYKVYKDGGAAPLGTTTATMYNDIVATGSTHNYQVSAVNSAGESAKSLPVVSATANPWTKLLGTAADDGANDMVIDSAGNFYVAGYTDGDLNFETNSGGTDAFIAKYDKTGTLIWVKLLGNGSFTTAYFIAIDRSGSIYITGITDVSLNLEPYLGGSCDTFVAKFDSSGNLVWVKLLGTAGDEYPAGIFIRDVPDSPVTVFVSGTTTGDLDGVNQGAEDIFTAKYDAIGNIQWLTQLGTAASDNAIGMAGDANGNVYITGFTAGNLDGKLNLGAEDVFLAKYNSLGAKQWVTLLGSAGSDIGNDIAIDGSGNIYVTGSTDDSLDGNPPSGNVDAFIAKFNSSGANQWVEQLVSAGDVSGRSMAIDASANIYITGETTGAIDANPYMGNDDIYIAKYNSAGAKQWVTLLGTADYEDPYTIVLEQSGNLLITGWTDGDLDGVANAGPGDVFLCKFSPDGTLW